MKNKENTFRFSEPDLSDSERLAELQALVGGSSQLLERALRRLSSYVDFLSDELDGNARAEDFLREVEQVTRHLGTLSGMLACPCVAGQTGDVLVVADLVHGVMERCRRLSQADYAWQGEAGLQTRGELFALQRVLLEMLSAAGRHDGQVTVTAASLSLTEAQARRWGIAAEAGDYVALDIVTTEAGEQEWLGLAEAAATGQWSEAMSRWGGMLCLTGWLGVLCGNGGELLLSPGGLRLLLRCPEPEPVAAVVPAEEEMPRGTETILLVDDEDMIWDLVIGMLQELGYTVILAGNGREAVETYSSNPGMIDLVIMDMVMPEMNGREAFERLHACDPQVRVLLSSGYVSEEDAHYVMEAGALGFLRKPYRLRELAKMVRKLLDRN